MRKMRALLALALAALLALAVPVYAETAECPRVETGVRDIQKYGNLVLDISGRALMALGYEYGDVLAVTIGGESFEAPICEDFQDVDVGMPLCCIIQAENPDANLVLLAINNGDLATWLGVASRVTIEEDPGFRWDYVGPYTDGVTVSLELSEKGGYLEGMALHHLEMSNERADYPDLTDEQYANFRNVATTGMGANVLYRSASPVSPEYNRNAEADAAVNAAGISTVLNLADSEAVMKGYEDYALTYYSRLDVIPLDLIVDYEAESFREGLADGLRFMASHEGPYLVHCTMGKDRAGFVCAVLECLMGASADEVVADYMVSYYNYYGVEPGSDIYAAIANSGILKSLGRAFGVESIYDADLAGCAEAYLEAIGMTADEIAGLKARLGADIK